MNPKLQSRLFGTDEPAKPSLALAAGPLQASLRGTRLGPITFHGHEVWHGVDFLFRDADWGTPGSVIDRLAHAQRADGFTLRREQTHTVTDGSYTQPIELFPTLWYPWTFRWHIDTLHTAPTRMHESGQPR